MTWSAYSPAVTAIAGTSLNGLANGAWVTGGEIDNSTDKAVLGDLAIRLSSAVTPTGSVRIDVYLIPDTNPEGTAAYATSRDDVASDTPLLYKVGAISAMAISSGFRYGMLRGIELPPGKFKIQITNRLGVALPSTNTNNCELFKYSPA